MDGVDLNSTLLLVNYFGFVDNRTLIKEIKEIRKDIIVICDNAQAYYDFPVLEADYSFASLRKFFPTAEGALLHSNNENFKHEADIYVNDFVWKKLLGSILKYYQTNDDLYLHAFTEGEIPLYNVKQVTKASIFGHFLFSTININEIEIARKRNMEYIYSIGSIYNINFLFKYNANVVPLCIPVLIDNRDEIRKKLFDYRIFLPVHWPKSKYSVLSRKTELIQDRIISFVIDQRYSEVEIDFQINKLFNLIS